MRLPNKNLRHRTLAGKLLHFRKLFRLFIHADFFNLAHTHLPE